MYVFLGLVFLDCMAKVQREGAQVLVIATAQSKEQLLKDVVISRGQHIFKKVLEIAPPTLVSISLEACFKHCMALDNHCSS